MTLQNITTKKIKINEFETEKRYFAETDGGSNISIAAGTWPSGALCL